MTSRGSQEGIVNALLYEGLKQAEAGDVQSALVQWRRAQDLSPDSPPARLLVYLAETYLETVSTGLDLSLPDFRSHLSEIGYVAEMSGRGGGSSGRIRMPGVPTTDDERQRRGTLMPEANSGEAVPRLASSDLQAERNRQALSATSGVHMAVSERGDDRDRLGDSAGDVKRTMYGMPLRQSQPTGEDSAKLAEQIFGTADGSGGSGLSSRSGRPRYQAKEPPPATHRRMTRQPEAPAHAPAEPPPRGRSARTTGERALDHAGPGGDPWADLSSELDEVEPNEPTTSGRWLRAPSAPDHRRPASSSRARPSSQRWPTGGGQRAGAPASGVQSGPSTGVRGSIDPRDDPFAVLEGAASSARTSDRPGSSARARRGTAPRTAVGATGDAEHPGAFTGERQSTRKAIYGSVGSTDTEPTFTPAPVADDVDFLPPPVEDLYDDAEFDLDSFLGEPSDHGFADSDVGKVPSDRQDIKETKPGDDSIRELLSSQLPESAEAVRYTGLGTRSTSSGSARLEEEALNGAEALLLEELVDGDLTEEPRSVNSELSQNERLLEEIVSLNPDDLKARRLLEKTRTQREKLYMARLGSMEATPRLVLGEDQLVWQNLDAKRGFVLSRVDGHMTIEDIIDIVNLPRHETIKILAEMVEEGILAVG